MVLEPLVEGMTCQITDEPVTAKVGGSYSASALHRLVTLPARAPPEKAAA